MGRGCSVCAHKDREAIDAALIRGDPAASVASRKGLSQWSMRRHREAHLPLELVALHGAGKDAEARSAVEAVRGLQKEALTVLNAAMAAGKQTVALNAIREARGLVELAARLTGELDDRPQQVVNVLLSGEWHQLRAAIFDALAPHPKAREVVAQRLLALESGK